MSGDTFVISGLRERRSSVAGRIVDMRRKIDKLLFINGSLVLVTLGALVGIWIGNYRGLSLAWRPVAQPINLRTL